MIFLLGLYLFFGGVGDIWVITLTQLLSLDNSILSTLASEHCSHPPAGLDFDLILSLSILKYSGILVAN